MLTLRRSHSSITLKKNVLIARQGTQVVLLPLSGQPMTLAVERRDDGLGYVVSARRGEQSYEVLAQCTHERQALRLLARISASGSPRVPALAVTALVALVVMFSGWFLFVLPSAPEALAKVRSAERRTVSLGPALMSSERRALPALGIDPAKRLRPPVPTENGQPLATDTRPVGPSNAASITPEPIALPAPSLQAFGLSD